MPTSLSSEGLDTRRRRVLFRAWHRGTQEMDIVMGKFADAELAAMSDTDLADFEALLEVPDRELFSWVSGTEEVPPQYRTPVFARMKAHKVC